MTALILVLGFFGNVTVMAGSSRQLFAFARDEGMPFSKWMAKVLEFWRRGHTSKSDICKHDSDQCLLEQIHPTFNVPVNAILVICGLAVVIALINLGSTAAFNIVTSLGTGTLTVSYIICISIIIWRKLAGEPLLPSRFNMGRVFGLCVNIIALGWLCLVCVIAFFPSVPAPLLTLAAMNWSVVVFLAVVLFSAVYFVVWGRKRYVGPVEYVRKLD
jgi:amino acid transporter